MFPNICSTNCIEREPFRNNDYINYDCINYVCYHHNYDGNIIYRFGIIISLDDDYITYIYNDYYDDISY